MKQKGFTLLELMIVVAVLAILTVLAVPTYDSFTRKSRLQEARAALLENAHAMEQYYAQHHHFRAEDDSNAWPENALVKTGTNFFDIAFHGNAADSRDDFYTMRARPKSSYSKENRYLEMDQTGSVVLCTSDAQGPDSCEVFN